MTWNTEQMYILSKYLTVQHQLGANDKENKLVHAEYRVNSFQRIFDLWLVKAMDTRAWGTNGRLCIADARLRPEAHPSEVN